MAFIRKKRQGQRIYYQLVESRREGTKVRQKVIAYLGEYPSMEEAIIGFGHQAEEGRARAEWWRGSADHWKAKIEATRPDLVPDGVPMRPWLYRVRCRWQGTLRHYWECHKSAQAQQRRAEKHEQMAERLRSAQDCVTAIRNSGHYTGNGTRKRSDQESPAGGTIVGTTDMAEVTHG